MSEINRNLMHRWFNEVWNQGSVAAIDELLAEDAILYGLADSQGNPVNGKDAFKAFHAQFRSAFPDISVTIEDTLCEGDQVAARCAVRGKHSGDSLGFAASDNPVAFTGMAIARIKDGKFVEAWNNFDFLALYTQIGKI
jgi:steroid delta-isomerase-like uncharacterized protein